MSVIDVNTYKKDNCLVFTVVGWSTFFFVITLLFIKDVSILGFAGYHFSSFFIWLLKEFGVSFLLTPFLLRELSFQVRSFKYFIGKLVVPVSMFWLVSMVARVFLEAFLEGGLIKSEQIIEFSKNYSAVVLFIVGLMIMISIFRENNRRNDKSKKINNKNVMKSYEKNISVTKGDVNVSFPVDDVVFVKACGNYMEVQSVGDVYLVRSTLTQLTKELCPGTFKKVHRSYLVNIHHVKTGRYVDGKYNLFLVGEHLIPVSKKHKNKISSLV